MKNKKKRQQREFCIIGKESDGVIWAEVANSFNDQYGKSRKYIESRDVIVIRRSDFYMFYQKF